MAGTPVSVKSFFCSPFTSDQFSHISQCFPLYCHSIEELLHKVGHVRVQREVLQKGAEIDLKGVENAGVDGPVNHRSSKEGSASGVSFGVVQRATCIQVSQLVIGCELIAEFA